MLYSGVGLGFGIRFGFGPLPYAIVFSLVSFREGPYNRRNSKGHKQKQKNKRLHCFRGRRGWSTNAANVWKTKAKEKYDAAAKAEDQH